LRSGSHRPRKRFGQHFLHDTGVRERLLDALDLSRADFVVEIGPGEGFLTGNLLETAGRVEAIEIDRDLVLHLKQLFPPLAVHCADALAFDYAVFPQGFRLVGNLPYNISTPLLFHLARYAGRVRDMHVMLQREVVERMVAKPSTPEYGRLSVMLQLRFDMKKLFRVPPGAFRPPPKVESAMVRMSPLPREKDFPEEGFERIVRQAFSARRKTLRNALPEIDFPVLGIDPGLRPENLSPGDYARIAQLVVGAKS
jgi:16S rRNA (adenine1518-N6/adenine1519-N6)-dimethyltransferase